MRRVPLAVMLVLLAGCGGDPESPPPDVLVESSADPRRNVLVIDDGFDRTANAFRGKLAGVYSINCSVMSAQVIAADAGADAGAVDAGDAAPSDAGAGGADDAGADGGMAGDAGTDLAQRKADLIAALGHRSVGCRLTPGVSDKPDPLAPIAHLRARWNDSIRNSRYASDVFSARELEQIRDAQKALGKARFHGTATAGVLAHANPELRLVLVEELLGTVESIGANFTCFKQQDIDENVALFTDPDVRQAYINRPRSALDDDFRDLQVRHRIGVVNESFGQLSRQALEALQASKGCPAVELRRYFSVIGELDTARARAQPEPDGLLVKSAGNDESRIDATEDHVMCAPAGPRLIVGAYDDTGKLTDFTNFGGCVDVLAPGHRIVTPIPGGWLMPLSGTSFSAPLIARLVSMLPVPVPFTAVTARDRILSMRDARSRIPLGQFPRELLYDPDKLANTYSLTQGPPTRLAPLIPIRKLREFEFLLRPR